jgi:hypothetical protein
MPWVGFEPMIPAFERATTVNALGREATVIGRWYIGWNKFASNRQGRINEGNRPALSLPFKATKAFSSDARRSARTSEDICNLRSVTSLTAHAASERARTAISCDSCSAPMSRIRWRSRHLVFAGFKFERFENCDWSYLSNWCRQWHVSPPNEPHLTHK